MIFLLPWLGQKGNKNQDERGESVLVCFNIDEVKADINIGNVRTQMQTFPDRKRNFCDWKNL